MKRYLSFHAGPFGYGYVKKSQAIPLVTGTQVHAALESVLKLVLAGTKPDDPASFRPVINKAIMDYVALVEEHGLDTDQGSVEQAIILQEQITLVEGLIWGWIRVMLPIILEEFEVEAIEQEELLVATPRIIQMSRPDILLRRKADGKMGVHDYKTTANVTDNMIREYQQSVQMMVGTLGAQARLREPVDHYYIHTLQKGGRGEFKKGSKFHQQYSHLCYAKIFPAQPPLEPNTTWNLRGYWIEKTPIWEVLFAQKPMEMSNSEFWVSQLPKETLYEMFTLIGPYAVIPHMVEQYMRSMPAEEERWIERLDKLYQSPHEWESQEFQALLDQTIPRSYNCYAWHSKCQHWDTCFRQPGWEDPVGSGRFAHRRPHHEAELEQMKVRGIPVPPLIGESE
jgi:hypothetical protein